MPRSNEPVVDYIILAEFDIDTGSTVRHQYPEAVSGYKSDWFAEYMLPEGAHNRESDWTYILLNRDQRQADENAWIHPGLEAAAPGAGRLMYGLNLVQTKMDTSVRRGAIVKAMAVFSRYPHLDVFKGPLQVALDVYFEQKSVEVLVDLFKSLNSIDLSSVPCPDALQLSMLVTHQTHTKPTPQICESSQPKLSMITFY